MNNKSTNTISASGLNVYFLLSEACLLEGNHTHPAWRVQVATPLATRALPMIAKWVDGHLAFCVELACALAAQALRLPVPAPGIIIAPKSYLPSLPLTAKGEYILLVGSEYKNADAFFAQVTANNPAAEEFIWSKLCSSNAGAVGAAWDELVANDDRHHQNALFDGVNWWLFDHDRALMSTGPFSKNPFDPQLRAALVSFTAKCNILADQMVARRPGSHGILDQPLELEKRKIELSLLSSRTASWTADDPKIRDILATTAILITAIELRLPALAQHLQTRVLQPSAESLWTSNTD
ncbi:hypothetical protein [Janthinobacterium lividum]|uniref:hypothetical protein n=1 Tax=Janthinobacterium lividum TaxID=29581 RepID=UPI001407F5A8|nr:hypothetical protein [Janthinobacterium lividum]NHQ93344.1 hypothetical protein [Janthinobacterium lividum]